MKPDPRVRKDSRCARKGCPSPLPVLARAEVPPDPFCSTKCCRLYHGIVFPGDTPRPRRNAADGVAA